MTSRLSKFEEFARVARYDSIDVKPMLLRVLTDFYVQTPTHTHEEEQHFTALALRLIEEVDEQTRAAAARKLIAYGGTPEVVLAKLGIATARGQPEQTRADRDAKPAAPHVHVSDEDRAAAARFSDFFFHADSDERRAMLRELDASASTPPLAVPSAEAAAATQRLEAAALRGRPFEFAIELERVLGIPRAYAEAVIKDASGEPILVVAKALSMPIEVVQRILLLVNPLIGGSVRRVFDLCALYEELSRPAALRLISLWRHAWPAHPAVYQPAQRPHERLVPREAAPQSAPTSETSRKNQRAS